MSQLVGIINLMKFDNFNNNSNNLTAARIGIRRIRKRVVFLSIFELEVKVIVFSSFDIS